MNGIAPQAQLLFSAIGGHESALNGNATTNQSHVILAWLGYWHFAPPWLLQRLLDLASPGSISKAIRPLKRNGMVTGFGMFAVEEQRRRVPSWECLCLTEHGCTALKAVAPKLALRHPIVPQVHREWRDMLMTQYMTIYMARREDISKIEWEHSDALLLDRNYRDLDKRPDAIVDTGDGTRIALEADASGKSDQRTIEQMRRLIADIVDGRYDAAIVGVHAGAVDRYERGREQAVDREAPKYGDDLHWHIEQRIRIAELEGLHHLEPTR